MNTYHKFSTTDKYEDSDESENCPGIMMSENKKIKVKKGWRFFSTLWTGKIVMVCRSKLSAAGRNAGVEAKAELYHHNDTWMVGAGFIILDTLDIECKVYPYTSNFEPNMLPLGNADTAYDHPYGYT